MGDVAGKGVETAALSAMVRFFIEARSWDSLCPADGARAGELHAARQAPARRVRDRLPRHPHERLAALLERRSPAAAARTRRARSSQLEGHGLPLGVLESQTYASSELRAGARRPRVRAHRRPDRGAPRRRDVRRGPACPVRGGRRRVALAEGARARRARGGHGVGGRDLRRRRGARAAAHAPRRRRIPLEWGPWQTAHTHDAGVDQLLSGNAVAALVEVLSGIRTGRPSRAALAERPLRERPEARRPAGPRAVLRQRRLEGDRLRAARALRHDRDRPLRA